MNSPSPVARTPRNRTVRPDSIPKPAVNLHIADVAALKNDGSTVIGQRRIPDLPVFHEAFTAFAKGTVFQAKTGFIAIEDLQPGDWLMTPSGQPEQVTWIGSVTFAPCDLVRRMPLIRVMADSFGVSRPESLVSLGPAARLWKTPADLRARSFDVPLMAPASRFLDGVNVIEVVPPSPVRLFHVAMRRHAALIANGLPVESYHPGTNPVSHMSQPLRDAFLALFPHIHDLTELGPLTFARAPDDRAPEDA
jgi:hypothetical protein